MVANQRMPETVGEEPLAVAADVCKALIRRHGHHSRYAAASGYVETLTVLGVKVRMIYRSAIDYSLGTDDWNVRFRSVPLPQGTTIRGDLDVFNRDMTVFKMVGVPYTVD